MITQPESLLTAGEYNDLKDATGDPSLSVELLQYSLSLALHDSDGPSCLRTFDAVVCDDIVIRAGRSGNNTLSVQTLATEDGGDENWSVVANLTATGITTAIPVSLVTDGVSTVRVFYYDEGTGQIEYFENVAKGVGDVPSWGASTLCMMVPQVVGLAATTLTRVHYLCAAGGYDNRHFRVATFNGAWSATSSEIYWQLPIDSFDAVVGPQTEDGAASTNDILVMATDLPHIIGRKIENGELIYTITQVQGIAIVRYQNGRWSDHYEFDVVDEAPSFPTRRDVRVSSSGGLLFMSYHREDGSSTYSHTSIAISRSKDGIHWELPYLLTDVLADSMLVKRGDHAYLLNSWRCYRSPSVGYTGDAQNVQDITDYVLARTVTSGDIKRLELTVANPEQVLDALGIFSTDMSLQVRLKDGYWSGGSELLVQTMLGDVDVLGGDEQLPTDRTVIEARDLLSRLTAIRADQVNEWESQRVTGDNFDQVSSSAYSGMRHTATLEGHWKTESNELFIVPKEATCVATHTGIPDAYNGSCQTGFKVARTDSEDCAGLLFRCHDKRNYMNVRYVAEDDQIILYRVQDNEETWIVKSVPMSWTYGTWYYLKIRFRYGYVWVYSSADGITWTEQISAPIHGVADGTAWTWANFAAYAIPNLTGKMGYIAHGYSDEDDSYIPRPPIIPPPSGPQGVFTDTGRRIISCDDGVFVCDEIEDTSPVWYAANAGLGACTHGWKIFRDPWHWWTTGGSEKTLWGIFSTSERKPERLYKHENFPDGTWQLMFDVIADLGGVTPALNDALGTIEVEDHIYLIAGNYGGGFCGYNVYMYRSIDGGLNWTNRGQIGIAADHCARDYPMNDDTWPHTLFHFNTAPHSGRQVFYFGSREFVGGPDVWKTLNEGTLWTNLGPDMVQTVWIYGFVIPYVSPTWTDTDVMYWSADQTNIVEAVKRSEDAGATFYTIGNLGAGYEIRALSVNLDGWDRNVLYSMRATGAAGALDRSDDRGASWVNEWVIAHGLETVALFNYGVASLDTIMTYSLSSTQVILVDILGNVVNKTGNLFTVAPGLTRITSIERDTLGTA